MQIKATIQGKTSSGNDRIYLRIPMSVIEFMGWQKAKDFQVDYDKRKDSITFTRIKEDSKC